MECTERKACFGGQQTVWTHASATLKCDMNLGVYLPPKAAHDRCDVLFWLSGLTCTEQNFVTKAGAQRYAAEQGLIVVAPDTSPRGDDVADDEAWDLGMGAGFYVNATQAPWAAHYRMYDYVARELTELVARHFPATARRGVSGHSMGGHGALVMGLREPELFGSISALAPIVAPTQVPWGTKAFAAYLGDDRSTWAAYDGCELVAGYDGPPRPLLVDQGAADSFLEEQLRPELLEEACRQAHHPIVLRMHEGYDHSYYFVSTFIGDHVAHHARALAQG